MIVSAGAVECACALNEAGLLPEQMALRPVFTQILQSHNEAQTQKMALLLPRLEKYLVCAGDVAQSARQHMIDAAELMRSKDGNRFQFSSNFDTNGVLWWLGTNGGTTQYCNPHVTGKVAVTPSSMSKNAAAPAAQSVSTLSTVNSSVNSITSTTSTTSAELYFIEYSDELVGYNCTNDAAGSTIMVQLPAPLLITNYTLRSDNHGQNAGQCSKTGGYKLRNWVLEGSNDGSDKNWVVLRDHVSDESLTTAMSVASWAVDQSTFGEQAFTYFRIRITGPNSCGNNVLMMAGLELYGHVDGYLHSNSLMNLIPTNGALSEIVAAHARRVERAEAICTGVLATEDATVVLLEETLAAAQAQFAAAQEHRSAVLAEQDALLSNFRAAAAEAEAAMVAFRARVATNGLDELDVSETCELFHQLGTPIPRTTLEKEEVSGVALIGLTEGEMLSVFSIKTLGERRRLTGALRRLANRQGFGTPNTLPWDVEQVCAWLAEQELKQLQEGFRSQSIDGEVLLTLTRDDFACLGVSTLGSKATLMKKIEKVKKQYYAGEVVGDGGGGGGGGGGSSAPRSEEQRQRMLEHVLAENDELAARLKEGRENAAVAGASAAAERPAIFFCPITTMVMEDPVVAMDGHTYERAAIETWFHTHDTSPMTQQVVPPMLVPNVSLRSMIASWGD